MKPEALVLVVNETAVRDFELFLESLALWNDPLPTIYLWTTTELQSRIWPTQAIIIATTGLDA